MYTGVNIHTLLRGIKNCMKKRTVDVRKECVHPLLEPKDIVSDELHLFLRKLCMVNETSTLKSVFIIVILALL